MADKVVLLIENEALGRRVKELEDRLALSDGCLNMVHEKLVHILGAGVMARTPPMFYPEAIHNLNAARLRSAVALAQLSTWLRKGEDSELSDRWICAPAGATGPFVARCYTDEDVTARTLAELALLLPDS